MVKKIYRTNDGREFPSIWDAQMHEAFVQGQMQLRQKLKSIVQEAAADTADDVLNLLMHHAMDVYKALKTTLEQNVEPGEEDDESGE